MTHLVDDIRTLKAGVRVRNGLLNAGVTTVTGAMRLHRQEMLSLPNFGAKSWEDLQAALAEWREAQQYDPQPTALERAAAAIQERLFSPARATYEDLARAAFLAVREPGQRLVGAVSDATDEREAFEGTTADIWRAGIDAILNEKPEP